MDDQKKSELDAISQANGWIEKIAQYERAFKKWVNRSEAIVKRYRDYDENDGNRKERADFNILWSNIQTLMPATFARTPKPDVSRRWRDNDPTGRVASLLLERALTFEIEHYADYESAMKGCVLDRFLGGRGTAWVRYEPHFGAMPGQMPEGVQITEDADETEPLGEQVEYECAPVDYVHWRDFGHVLARTWEEVPAVWRIVYQDRQQLVDRFGEEIGYKIPLDTQPKIGADTMQKTAGAAEQTMACIYEIWDKKSGKALWLSKSLGRIIDERPDPLGLENFFPCPRPLFATMTTDTLIPVPDYKMYQDQARALDKLYSKIDGLIDQLQVKGVYDASIPELSRLFKEAGNGTLIPVKTWQQFAEKAGLKGALDILDITPVVGALNGAYAAAERIENSIYQLVGVSDIVRGASDPQETYGAQKLKGQYGNMRLRSKQEEVVKFATSLLQIKAEIICNHFQPQSFLRIAAADQLSPEDQQLVPQALQLLMGERAFNPEADGNSPLTAFRIEVSSDSMVQMDEAQDKAERTEFLAAVSTYIAQTMPLVKESPQMAPLIVGLLKFGVAGYKVGKQVEGMIDLMLDQMTQQASQPQPEKPDPDIIKAQAQMQLEDKKAQNEAQLEQMRIQSEKELAAFQQQVQAEQNAHQQSLDAQRADFDARLEANIEMQRQEGAREIESMRQQFQMLINQMNNEAKLDVAQIQAQTTLQAAQESASDNAVRSE